MRHLNYGHLQYFYAVAKHGSVTRASELLHLTPQTISGQLRLLEEAVGRPLFERVGRRLVLTETGHLVYRYADEIFSLGSELAQAVRDRLPAAPMVLNVGITQSVPKLVAHRMLTPALELAGEFRIVCIERGFEEMLAGLALHELDLVLSDRPAPPGTNVKVYSHFLGECGTTFFCRKSAWKRTRRPFPESLRDVRLLLPRAGTALRSQLDEWLDRHEVGTRLAHEFDDNALLHAFGMEGAGVFPGPSALEREICSMYRVTVLGRTQEVLERFYAISPERRLKHPAVVAISEAARNRIFAAH